MVARCLVIEYVARIGKEKVTVLHGGDATRSPGATDYGAYKGIEMHFVNPKNEEKQLIGQIIKIYEGSDFGSLSFVEDKRKKKEKQNLFDHLYLIPVL